MVDTWRILSTWSKPRARSLPLTIQHQSSPITIIHHCASPCMVQKHIIINTHKFSTSTTRGLNPFFIFWIPNMLLLFWAYATAPIFRCRPKRPVWVFSISPRGMDSTQSVKVDQVDVYMDPIQKVVEWHSGWIKKPPKWMECRFLYVVVLFFLSIVFFFRNQKLTVDNCGNPSFWFKATLQPHVPKGWDSSAFCFQHFHLETAIKDTIWWYHVSDETQSTYSCVFVLGGFDTAKGKSQSTWIPQTHPVNRERCECFSASSSHDSSGWLWANLAVLA